MNIIVGGSKKQITLSLSKSATVGELKKDYAAQTKKSIHRLSFKTGDGKTRLDDDKKSLSEYGVNSGDNVIFKVCECPEITCSKQYDFTHGIYLFVIFC